MKNIFRCFYYLRNMQIVLFVKKAISRYDQETDRAEPVEQVVIFPSLLIKESFAEK